MENHEADTSDDLGIRGRLYSCRVASSRRPSPRSGEIEMGGVGASRPHKIEKKQARACRGRRKKLKRGVRGAASPP